MSERLSTSPWLDRPVAIRDGEELDAERLAEFLESAIPGLIGPLAIEQFPRGFSNLTYSIRAARAEGAPLDLVLRRAPFGADIRGAHDMGREFSILDSLQGVYTQVPRPLAYCEDPDVLGSTFYVMERVPGVILRGQMPQEMTPVPAVMSGIASGLVETLAELHQVDYRAVGLGELGRPEGYIERQVLGWARRYDAARTDDIEEMVKVSRWLVAEYPSLPSVRPALIHNDFKYDNLVLDPTDWTQVLAVLDWEMATLGDPRMDLGTTLGYWVDPDDPPELVQLSLSPTTLPGNPGRTEVAHLYSRSSGLDLEDLVFFYAFGLFKIAVIVQQIYHRYQLGHTQDPRFAHLIDGVKVCARSAHQAILKGRIARLFE